MRGEIKGEVVYLFAFDVADEIRTAKVSEILSEKAMSYGVRRDRMLPKTIPFYHPLTIDLKRDAWKIRGQSVQPVVRIYDVGVVSIVISVPFISHDLIELMDAHRPVLDSGHALDETARQLCSEIVDNLRPFLVRSVPAVNTPEAYTVFCLTSLDGESSALSFVETRRREIAGLLAETESALLSEQQIQETFRHAISFSCNDLTIIDWDAALIIDLSSSPADALHVLELANLQLEELVLMDKRLDVYLEDAYWDLERKKSPLLGLPRRELAKLRRFRMDVAKITDEVSNISKFFGDWYLARIYLAARERFHLATWRESIHSRLGSLDNLYEVFRSESTEARMLLLEILIVLLFVIDLAAVFYGKR